MCGRFAQKRKPAELAKLFRLTRIAEAAQSWEPRYNLSPTQNALVIRASPDSERELTIMRWGLIPHWSKEPGGYSTFNARAETLDTKPTFRSAFRHHRAIIPADGYFEWQAIESSKKPMFFHRPDNEPLALAGLWDSWLDPDGKAIESFTIVVRPARPDISAIHDRMPAILPEEQWSAWLNPETQDLAALKTEILSGESGPLDWNEVSKLVNSGRNEGPDLILAIRSD